MMDCDAVVVGGGFAGVTAARELQSRGLHTVLLEARDRLGGRTWTTEFAGRTVEMGGASIHWRQAHVWAEMTRYSLPIVDDSWTYDAALFGMPPRRLPPDEAFAKVREAFTRFAIADHAALPRPYDPLYAATELRELDLLSMQDRLDEMELSEAERDWLTGLLYTMAAGPLDQAALTFILRWLALCDWDIDKYDDELRYRPVGGTVSILEAMLSGGRVDVRLSSPVSAVEISGDAVRVTMRSGEALSAPVGVMAVPVNVWPTIEFTPQLPSSHREAAAAGMAKPHQDKVFIHVRGDIGRVYAQLPAPEPLGYFLTHAQEDETQLIVGLNSNPSLDVTDKQQVATTICQYIPEIEEVLDVRAHAWGADEYSRGGNTLYRPGQLTSLLADLQRPLGRLAFAGADIASGYFGNMDGAIESGLRAARLCLQAVQGPRNGA